MENRLHDAPRPGKPAQIGPEALCQIMALACQPPEQNRRPITHLTARELAGEAIAQAIVPTISPRHGGSFLKQADLKAHLSRYWLTAEEEYEAKDAKIKEVCSVYRDAAALTKSGERVLSTDEMTGVQAFQRKHPGLAMTFGHVQRREFEYIWHGTLAFIVNFDVASGQVGPNLRPPSH